MTFSAFYARNRVKKRVYIWISHNANSSQLKQWEICASLSVLIGGVGITTVMLVWNRAKKMTALAEKSHLTAGSETEMTLSMDVTAATAPGAVTPDSPLEGESTMNNEERSPEIIPNQDAETHTNGYPYPESEGKLSIFGRLFLTLITLGIYGMFWYGKQMQILNGWLGRETFSFWKTVGLSLLTCGVYGLYTEYQMARAIVEVRVKYDMQHDPNFPIVYMLFFFFTIVLGSFAIMQNEINKLYDEYPKG